MRTYAYWVACVEQLPADEHGFRRVLRLHAVGCPAAGGPLQAVCGYEPDDAEMRPDRAWDTVTASGRCALCTQHLRRLQRPRVVDLTERPVRTFDGDGVSPVSELRRTPRDSEGTG